MTSQQLSKNHCLDFILAGKAVVTFKSRKTGRHFTYRIIKKKRKTEAYPFNIWFVSVLYQPNDKFKYIGCIIPGEGFVHTIKSQVSANSPSFQAFHWVIHNIDNEIVEVWHEGKCGRCGRSLTDPESIKSGYGPTCRKIVNRANN